MEVVPGADSDQYVLIVTAGFFLTPRFRRYQNIHSQGPFPVARSLVPFWAVIPGHLA